MSALSIITILPCSSFQISPVFQRFFQHTPEFRVRKRYHVRHLVCARLNFRFFAP